jgi:hypothetical protein
MPLVIDRVLRRLVVTPDSLRPPFASLNETNNNWFNLPWWIACSYVLRPAGRGHTAMALGCRNFLMSGEQSGSTGCRLPFGGERDYPIGRH